jgi:hypothetical protein
MIAESDLVRLRQGRVPSESAICHDGILLSLSDSLLLLGLPFGKHGAVKQSVGIRSHAQISRHDLAYFQILRKRQVSWRPGQVYPSLTSRHLCYDCFSISFLAQDKRIHRSGFNVPEEIFASYMILDPPYRLIIDLGN